MIASPFAFHAPPDVEGVLRLLADHGPDATVLAGGMSLVPAMNLGLVRPSRVVSLNHVPELAYVRQEAGSLKIGAMVRHGEIAAHPAVLRYFPALSEAASHIGDVQVRHRGTIGGSVAHADPAADYLPVLAAGQARLLLRSIRGERRMSVADFVVGVMTTGRDRDELLTEIEVPKLGEGARSGYVRFARAEGSFAIVNAAALVEPDPKGRARIVRVAVGGVGATPVLIEVRADSSGAVTGGTLEQVSEAAYAATEHAHADIHADRDYRRALARVFATRAVMAAVNQRR